MNHTPKPWIYDGDSSIQAVVRTVDGLPICNLRIGESREQEDADAYLIAASPDLLQACKLALYNKHPSSRARFKVFETLEAAIAKAQPKQEVIR